MTAGTATGPARPGPWAPLRHRAFLAIWAAMLLSNAGTWIRDLASGWYMTELSPSPMLVSLVQAATTLPIVLLSLPAGALADIVDRRRLLIGVQLFLMAVGLVLTVIAHFGGMTPLLLLGLILLGGAGAAVASPAFQSILPELVSKGEVRSAVALNSLGINIARAVGPALGGLVIATAGVAAAYLLDAISYLFVIGALVWWRRKAVPADLPPESFLPAIRTGMRYALGSPEFRRVLVRAVAFFLFASAYWALLPLIARVRLDASAGFYGVLMAAIGAGALTGALLLPRLKLTPDGLVLTGTLTTAVVTAALAVVTAPWVAALLLFLAGSAWIAVLTSLNVAAQTVLPDWVRARGLAVYLMTFFGAMTAGAALWGGVAQAVSIPAALLGAATVGAVAGMLVARLVHLPLGDIDLAPSMHWPEPVTAGPVHGDRGPVLISVEYRIDPADRRAFSQAMQQLGVTRRRDGGFGWRLLEDVEDPGRFEEIFFAVSWLEHLRQHRRVTTADAAIQATVNAFHRGPAPPRVRHLLAAGPEDEATPAPPTGEHRD